MLDFVYLCLTLFIIIFILYLFIINIKKCPKKIKIFFAITFLLLIIRYISMLICSLIDEQSIVYLLKEFVLINYCAVPLLALGVSYIFLREEDKSFDYNFIFMIILFAMYVGLILIYKVNISIDNVFGFVITFKNSLTPNLIYLIIIASLAVVSLLSMEKPYSNKWGMRFLTISLMISILEFVIFLGGIKILPHPFVGEILILLNSYKALRTFK